MQRSVPETYPSVAAAFWREPMMGMWASRIGLFALVMAAVVTAEPRLHVALEDRGDPQPQQFALTGEIMGMAMGLVISWSRGKRQLYG